MIDQFIASV